MENPKGNVSTATALRPVISETGKRGGNKPTRIGYRATKFTSTRAARRHFKNVCHRYCGRSCSATPVCRVPHFRS